MKAVLKRVSLFILCFICLIFLYSSQSKTVTKHLITALDESSPYGINTHNLPNGTGGEQAMNLAVDAGVKWIRIDMNWRDIETTPGNYSWAAMNTIFNYAKSKGLGILANLAYTPSFYGGGSSGSHLPAQYLPQWEAFVGEAVNHYKSYIKHWEIWNEPNLTQFWEVSSEDGYASAIDGYLFVLQSAASMIKTVDPSAYVCAPALSGRPNIQDSWVWLNMILLSKGSMIDIITHHQYDGTAYERIDKIDQLYTYISALGYGGKPFWLTETGWQSTESGECDQAINLRVMMREMLNRSWWNKTFWYMLRDTSSDKHGIIKEDNSVKLSWCGYREMTHPKKPELYSPLNEAIVKTKTPVLKWENKQCKGLPHSCEVIIQVDYYQVEVRNASSGVLVASANISQLSGSMITWTVPSGKLSNNIRYRWRVRYKDKRLASFYPWTEYWYFKVSL